MDLQFHKTPCQCMKKVLSQVQNREETQELRLPDHMADIGSVLGCWGQVLIRGKEWRSDSFSISGGVKVWVMYEPEDNSEPGCIESWIPFQVKWDIQKAQRDGIIHVWPLLRGVDARNVSTRKLILRCSVSLLGEALEPSELELFTPKDLPEDVQLLTNSYPTRILQEAGEKLVQVDEELPMHDSMAKLQKILRAELIPEISEYKVMAGRLVFRGKCRLHILYLGENGSISAWDTEQTFSQYTELERDYSGNATASLFPVVTSLEFDVLEGQKIYLKCNLAVQYQVNDQVMLKLVEDAYSPQRAVVPQFAQMEFPMLLDSVVETQEISKKCPEQMQKIVDIGWNGSHPDMHHENGRLEIAVSGQFQILYYDEEGKLKWDCVSSNDSWSYPSDGQNYADVYLRCLSQPQILQNSAQDQLSNKYTLETAFYSKEPLLMLTGVQFGEIQEPDSNRPSLVIRRVDEGGLWELAKSNGSTVDAIQSANQLEEKPEPGKMLLIPVI